jgi:hypothetical protein
LAVVEALAAVEVVVQASSFLLFIPLKNKIEK